MKAVFRPVLILFIAAMILFPAQATSAKPLASVSLTFHSAGALDGRILESGETTSMGGSVDAAGVNFPLGDNATNRQYRAVLSFNTGTIPDTATIIKVKLKIKRAGLVGTSPFTTHGRLIFDMRKPFFGTTSALVASDFQAAASKINAGQFSSTPVSGGTQYQAILPSTSFIYINKAGLTQFRLRFSIDDNNDAGADYMLFRSGNYTVVSDRPELEVEYNP
jgi:hypothetical protein